MRDLWDEDLTNRCREAFIARMYSFPATPSVPLSNGHAMPVLGESTWLRTSVQDTVQHALRSSFRCSFVLTQPLAVCLLVWCMTVLACTYW